MYLYTIVVVRADECEAKTTKKTIVNREFPIAARHSDLVLLFSSFFYFFLFECLDF